MTAYPETSFLELLRLGGHLTTSFLRRPQHFDVRASLLTGLQQLAARLNYPPGIVLHLLGKQLLLIIDPDLSDHILAATPSQQTYVAGELKRQSMAVLAPEALTISQDDQWQQLRPYNERVLATHTQHPYQGDFLAQVQAAFQDGVSDLDTIRQAMGIAMLGIVLGESSGSRQLLQDVNKLAELVQNPLQRLVVGRLQTRRRDRLYSTLRQLWHTNQTAHKPSLLAIAQAIHPTEVEENVLLQQIPHWMFTFTGSGSTLLGRTLTLITAQPHILERVQQELSEASPPEQSQTPNTIARLAYLEACLLETGRLYPPVLFTLHQAPQGDRFQDLEIPADIDLLQVFPIMQHPRDRALQSSDFQPERWLSLPLEARELPYSNLFLRGARTCPGKDLILFVCKGAIAHLLTHHIVHTAATSFNQAAWPTLFPDNEIQFQSQSR